MALCVWLPLNGNLNNQGLSNQGIITTTPAYTNGKIGQCLTTGGLKFTASQAEEIFNDNGFSYCCWIYIPVDAGTAVAGNNCFFGRNSNPRIYSLFQYPNVDDLHLSWIRYTNSEKTTTDATVGGVWADFFEVRTWIHLAVTYKPGEVKIYKNGELFTTLNKTIDYTTYTGFNYETDIVSNSSQRYLNDVRIYDECLSQKQIKEISKGLVAHYKLEGIGANPNLAKNTNTANLSTNTCYQHFQTGGSTREIEYDEYGIPCVKITRDDVTQSGWQYLSYDNFDRTAIKTSTIYTVSMDVKASVSGTISLTGLLNGNATNYMTNSSTTINGTVNANQWNHLVFTCTTIADFSSIATTAQVIYWSTSAALRNTGVILWIKNVKLEEGNQNTSWIPNTADVTYTALGYDNMIARDVSGNGYNGTISGTLNYNVDSSRYSGSTTLTNAYISSPAGAVLAKSKDFTINGWFYHTSGINYYASAENYNTSVCLENGRFFVYPTSGSAYVGTWSAINNIWQMLTLVHNSTAKTLTLYVNGVQTAQITTDGTVYPNETLNIGGRQNTAGYTGSMSDFRIYATALTADDILTLYKTSGIIDNKQVMYGYEFKEV